MNSNLVVRNFKNGIVNAINSADIPIEVKRLVVKDILTELTELADAEVTKALQEEQNEQSV